MKRYTHWLFYAAALVSMIGMILQWQWIKGGFDGWFPVAMVLMGQLARIRSGAPETWVDRTFASQRAEKLAIASIVAVVLGISLWAAYTVYVWIPMNDRAGVQEYLDARAKQLQEGRK